MVLEAAESFWRDYVEPRIPPPVDGSESWSRYLKERVRQTSDLVVKVEEPSHELHGHVERFRTARAQLELLEVAVEESKNAIKAFIGERAGCEGPWGRITWKATRDTEKTSWEALARHLIKQQGIEGAALEQLMKTFGYTQPGSRRFLPKLKGEEESS